MIETFHDLFVDHDVDLVISGHDHHFEIAREDEVVYAIVGVASTRLDSRYGNNNTNSIYCEVGKSGFTTVEINGSSCTIEGHLYENGVMAEFPYTFSK